MWLLSGTSYEPLCWRSEEEKSYENVESEDSEAYKWNAVRHYWYLDRVQTLSLSFLHQAIERI